jgi:hypothetical protein
MTDLAVGDTLRIPFLLYDSSGAEVVDTTAGNYTWPLVKDGTAVTSPSFTIDNPTGNGLELVYTPPSAGNYTFADFSHSTNTPDLVEGGFMVRQYSIDSIISAIALPAAAPVGTVAEIGEKVRSFRNADWSQTFHLTDANGDDLDVTGSTFIFRIGYRTAASDEAEYESDPITPDSPATAGNVTVELDDADTAILPVSADLWYELEETTSGGDVFVRALGPFENIRDIPPAGP